MKRRETQDPLSEDFLPSPTTDRDSAFYEDRVQLLMAEAKPILAELRTEPEPWWSFFALKLRPRLAVAVAAAAVAMIAVHLSVPMPTDSTEASPPLAAVAGDGNETTALWSSMLEEIDPVLALVILEGETP